MGDHMGRAPDKPEPSAGDAPLVLVRGVDDVWTLSVDSSGQRLHRRGWRAAGGEAPMRESLAAAALALASWSSNEALVDPMCGAGTIPIEACTVALDMAPGSSRAFAFERWPALARSGGARDRWAELQAEAHRARREVLRAPIGASDQDPTSVATTRENAARAGVAAHLVIDQRPLADLEPPEARGLLIANPPYGERLGRRRDLPSLYREIGRVLRHRLAGWRAAVVVPDVRLASAFRLTLVSSHALVHGGLRIALLQFAPHSDSPA
jgi:23S rRNA G2445 N2-methylase RlmL